MTREEALQQMKIIRNDCFIISSNKDIQAFEMATEALKGEPCKDAISRQTVLSMQYRINDIATFSTRGVVNVDDIEDLPPVTLAQRMGHWTKQTLSVRPFGEDTVLCDQCAFMTDKDNTYNFCPNCGAKMI